VTGVQTCALPISPKPQNPLIKKYFSLYKIKLYLIKNAAINAKTSFLVICFENSKLFQAQT
jgi:hypothetical protein